MKEIFEDDFLTGRYMTKTRKYRIELKFEINFNFWTTPVVAWNNHSRTIEMNVLFLGLYIDFIKI